MTEPPPNPYAMPMGEFAESPARVDFAEVIRNWETLRIFYNGILIFFTLLLGFSVYPQRIFDAGYWAMLLFGGVIANLCYCAGPTVEGYGRYFGIWRPSFTKALFYAGTAFTTLLAVLCIVSY